MKIRTEKDVEKLDQRIKQELDLDVRKYRNEEVVEKFVSLLVFPEYVINWVVRPILFSIAAFILGFFVLHLVHIEYVIYGLIGLSLFLSVGIIAGLLFLSWRMKSDMWGIVAYSLEIMKSAVRDINLVNNQITPENRKEVLALLFKGIIHIVTIPLLAKVISEKVPWIGGLVNRLMKRILMLVSDMVKFDEKALEAELSKQEGESNTLQVYANSIDTVTTGLEKVMGFTFGVAQLPLKIGLAIILLILGLFLYLIN